MKLLILITFSIVSNVVLGQHLEKINPTGTYVLNKNVDRNADKIFSYFGDCQVIQINKDSIIINFFVSMGEPSYNSGSFIDTLEYKNNYAEYKIDEDPSCIIRITFEKNRIYFDQEASNPNFACGFGHAVSINDFYYKTSSKTPELIDFFTGEKLKN